MLDGIVDGLETVLKFQTVRPSARPRATAGGRRL
jgi:hypothetical protein